MSDWVTVVIPTRQSARWIGALLAHYRARGFTPILLLDDRTTDATRAIASANGAAVVDINGFSFTEAIVKVTATCVPTPWCLFMHDDEMPGDRLFDRLRGPPPSGPIQSVAIRRRWAWHVPGERLAWGRSARWHDRAGCDGADHTWRLFRPREVTFISVMHTEGYLIDRWSRFAPDLYFVHFEWVIRTRAQREAKLARYDAHRDGYGRYFRNVYLPEDQADGVIEYAEFETDAFDALARCLFAVRDHAHVDPAPIGTPRPPEPDDRAGLAPLPELEWVEAAVAPGGRVVEGRGIGASGAAETCMTGPVLYPPPELRIPSPEEDRNPVDPFGLGLQDIVAAGWFKPGGHQIVEGMTISRDDVVLDCGCGVGRFAAYCAATGCEVILVDENAATLARARERCVAAGAARVETHVGRSDPLPVPDALATRVLCTEVLEHVEDPDRVVAELVRVGRPGALYLFTVPAPGSERIQQRVAPGAYFEPPHHVRIFDRDRLDAVIEGAGLVIERRSQNGFFWSVFFSMYWATGYEAGTTAHPALDHWTEAWRALLATPAGHAVKAALDDALPKSLVTLARKPGGPGMPATMAGPSPVPPRRGLCGWIRSRASARRRP